MRWREPWSTAAEPVATAEPNRPERPRSGPEAARYCPKRFDSSSPTRLRYWATDLGVGTIRVTRIADRSISSLTRGATSFFQ